jgi:hypothetical protein
MIEESQVLGLVESFVKAWKKSKHEDPYYTHRYVKSVELFRDIEIHAKGLFPEKLIGKNAPSETDEELEWRKLAYAAQTKAPWSRLENAVGSIYHGVDVSTEDEDFARYLVEDYPEYTGLKEWFAEVALPAKAQDANAVVYVTLTKPPESDVEFVEPVARIANSPQVIDLSRNYALLLVAMDAPVKRGRDMAYEGLVFSAFDEVNEWRITQVGRKEDYVFEAAIYYNHNLNHIPVYQLKGKPVVEHGELIWESLFQNVTPYLDKVAVTSSTLDAVIRRTGFPIRAYYDEDCDAEGCTDGWVLNAEGHRDKCNVCKGTGKKAFTPFTDYVHQKPTGMMQDSKVDFPGLTYISPDNAPMEFLDAYIDKLIEKAGEAVNYDLSRKRGGELTATEANIDLNEWYKTALLFAQQIYDVHDYVIGDIALMRYPTREIEYRLNRRVEFSIRNPEQLSAELKQANEAGLPGFVVTKLIDSQIQLRFSDDYRMTRFSEIARYVDPMYGLNSIQSLSLIGRAVQDWQAVLHFQFEQIIEELESVNESFLEQELPDIKSQMEANARGRVAIQQPTNILGNLPRLQ